MEMEIKMILNVRSRNHYAITFQIIIQMSIKCLCNLKWSRMCSALPCDNPCQCQCQYRQKSTVTTASVLSEVSLSSQECLLKSNTFVRFLLHLLPPLLFRWPYLERASRHLQWRSLCLLILLSCYLLWFNTLLSPQKSWYQKETPVQMQSCGVSMLSAQ